MTQAHYQGDQPSGVRAPGGRREGAPRPAPQRLHFPLYGERQRAEAVKALANLPDGYWMELHPPRRTIPQNRLLHSIVADAVAAGIATDDGRRLTLDEAKVAFVTGWMLHEGHASDLIAFGGKLVQLRRSTTTFTKAEFSDLIEFIYAECAERAAAGKMKPLPPPKDPAPARMER